MRARFAGLGVFALLLACDAKVNPGDAGSGLPDSGARTDSGTPFEDGGVDAGFFGASRCSGAGLVYCEDFETGHIFDGGLWLRDTKQGTLTLDSTHVARGTSALHVHVENAAINYATLINKSFFADGGWPGNHFFGRTFFWLSPSATVTHNLFMSARGPILYPDGGVSPTTAYYGLHELGRHFWTAYGRAGPRDAGTCDCGVKGSDDIPVEQWLCLEWEYNGPENSTHTWLNEQPLAGADITPEDGFQAPRFQTLTFGFFMDHTEPDAGAYDLWYDEFALDNQRIGCRR